MIEKAKQLAKMAGLMMLAAGIFGLAMGAMIVQVIREESASNARRIS